VARATLTAQRTLAVTRHPALHSLHGRRTWRVLRILDLEPRRLPAGAVGVRRTASRRYPRDPASRGRRVKRPPAQRLEARASFAIRHDQLATEHPCRSGAHVVDYLGNASASARPQRERSRLGAGACERPEAVVLQFERPAVARERRAGNGRMAEGNFGRNQCRLSLIRYTLSTVPRTPLAGPGPTVLCFARFAHVSLLDPVALALTLKGDHEAHDAR
jgi:hypothetical protein